MRSVILTPKDRGSNDEPISYVAVPIDHPHAIIAYVNYSDSSVDPGWWVNPMVSSKRSSRKRHATPQAAVKAYGWKLAEIKQ